MMVMPWADPWLKDSIRRNIRTKTGPQHVHTLICWLKASLFPSIEVCTKYDLRSWTRSRGWRWGGCTWQGASCWSAWSPSDAARGDTAPSCIWNNVALVVNHCHASEILSEIGERYHFSWKMATSKEKATVVIPKTLLNASAWAPPGVADAAAVLAVAHRSRAAWFALQLLTWASQMNSKETRMRDKIC